MSSGVHHLFDFRPNYLCPILNGATELWKGVMSRGILLHHQIFSQIKLNYFCFYPHIFTVFVKGKLWGCVTEIHHWKLHMNDSHDVLWRCRNAFQLSFWDEGFFWVMWSNRRKVFSLSCFTFMTVYQQWDRTTIGDSDCPAGLNSHRVGCQVVHTPPQRRRCDVVPEFIRQILFNKRAAVSA